MIKVFGLVWKNDKLSSNVIKLPKPGIRKLKDESKVLISKVKKNIPIYYMYRDVHLKEDEVKFRKNKVRYDITVIPPHKFGKEEVKTLGHYHPHLKGKRISYPEIYEVLHGEGIFLIQNKKGSKIVDAIAIKGKKGDIIIVPPNYGHITINPSKKVLIMCNLVSNSFSSIYKDIIKKHGAGYYYIIEGGKGKFIKNPSYKNLPYLRLKKNKKEFGLCKNIYEDFVKKPEKYDMLNNPDKYEIEFKKLIK
ncbi:MAG: glucose-6-phosphate isomerase [Nanoarchaeota archaeon]|nr:glucose-6-phosphate isomerase [Nanoarchaeota archaeon]